MIAVNGLTKIYHLTKKQMAEQKQKKGHEAKQKVKQKVAVDNISFEAQAGEIFGLLGPNGAGKTTTLRSIATLLKPTRGQILVDGVDVVEQAALVRSKIGFLTNELKLDTHFTPRYTMRFFGKLHGMNDVEIEKRTALLFEAFGITEFADKRIGELSTGMSQKTSIAVSLVHDPMVVIFDEPTNGLDVITARAVTEYLKTLRDEGKLVIISTHIMHVAEQLCDRMAIILEGKIAVSGNLDTILRTTETKDLEAAFFKLYEAAMTKVV